MVNALFVVIVILSVPLFIQQYSEFSENYQQYSEFSENYHTILHNTALHNNNGYLQNFITINNITVFICIEAQAFISYKRLVTRHLYVPFLHFI